MLAVISRNWMHLVDCVWNVMAHAQKPDFVFRRKGRVHLNRRGRQFSRLLAAVVLLDTPCSQVVWRVLATYSIRQFPLHFPSRASWCAITFQLESTKNIAVEAIHCFCPYYFSFKDAVHFRGCRWRMIEDGTSMKWYWHGKTDVGETWLSAALSTTNPT